MTIIECSISLFAYSVSVQVDKKQSEPVYKMAIFFYAMASLMEVILWLYLFTIRFSHAGQVCSGDFLPNSKPRTGYCPVEGLFIKMVAGLILSACCCLVFLVPYLSHRKKKRDSIDQNQ